MPPLTSQPHDRAALFAELKAKRPLKPAVNLLTGEPLNSFAPRGSAQSAAGDSGIDAETRQANGRLARQIARRTPNQEAFTELLPILDTALQDDPQQAGLEIGDLIDQLAEQSPDHAQQLAQAVLDLGTAGQDGFPPIPARRPDEGLAPPPQAQTGAPVAAPPPKAQPGDFPLVLIPDYKKQLPGVTDHWDDITAAVERFPGMTPGIRRAFLETFAAEGGLEPDLSDGRGGTVPPRQATIAGIRPTTLDDDLRRELGIDDTVMPVDLSLDQLVKAYWEYMNRPEHFDGGVGGIQNVESLQDDEAIAVLNDTIFRHGGPKGALIVQEAMNQLLAEPVSEDETFGSRSFTAYKQLIKNSDSRRQLFINIGKGRYADKPNERDRAIHFMFLPPGVEPPI